MQDEADIGGNLGASELIVSQKPGVYDLWASATYCLPTNEIWTLSSFQFRNEYFFEKSRLPGTRCEAVGMKPPALSGCLKIKELRGDVHPVCRCRGMCFALYRAGTSDSAD